MNVEIVNTIFFRGNRIDTFKIDDKEYFLVDQIVRALGYSQIQIVYSNIRKIKEKFKTDELIKIHKDDIRLTDLLNNDTNSDYFYCYFVNERGLTKLIDIVTESCWLDR